MSTQAQATFVEEVFAVHPAEIDASLVAKGYDAAGFRDVLRYPKRGRKIVSRSYRKDSDWQLELYQSFENSIKSAVAATDDNTVDLAAAVTEHGRQTSDWYIRRIDHIDAQSGESRESLRLVFASTARTRVHVQQSACSHRQFLYPFAVDKVSHGYNLVVRQEVRGTFIWL